MFSFISDGTMDLSENKAISSSQESGQLLNTTPPPTVLTNYDSSVLVPCPNAVWPSWAGNHTDVLFSFCNIFSWDFKREVLLIGGFLDGLMQHFYCCLCISVQIPQENIKEKNENNRTFAFVHHGKQFSREWTAVFLLVLSIVIILDTKYRFRHKTRIK